MVRMDEEGVFDNLIFISDKMLFLKFRIYYSYVNLGPSSLLHRTFDGYRVNHTSIAFGSFVMLKTKESVLKFVTLYFVFLQESAVTQL